MPRYYPQHPSELNLPHINDDMWEPNAITATEIAGFKFLECTWSGYSDTELEDMIGLAYFHSDRIKFDQEAEDLLEIIYSRCDNYFYCYKTKDYIAVKQEKEIKLSNRIPRPHYHAYQESLKQ